MSQRVSLLDEKYQIFKVFYSPYTEDVCLSAWPVGLIMQKKKLLKHRKVQRKKHMLVNVDFFRAIVTKLTRIIALF